ncbi:integrase [Brucella inopinata BO1]|uniref:Integrase n=3 Tax=Brucella suis TaxID=29461 RepID=A0AAI8EAW9_BRUSS|nr:MULTISPECIES: site-specific integrase [Brucella]KEY03328.1 integrase [Brucella inopinata BO1]AAN33560.1 site-specific recombinase, phage integrase family [Brucella suis 1330]AEM19839.1 phage integrase family site specific recombinase [Brucella suis 1330]AEU07509.1 phage integrase family site specific recombinase [Brucella suis VBI22]AHN48108.1 phage integrase site specific recombinase [Brucella suis bv. 1 str. S2]
MLTDTKLRNLKPKDKLYKVNDRDGLYVAITPAGSISFRYNYSIHGRQETITFGRYGVGGITLAEARERLGEAKKMIAAGKSPAKEKARDKARVKDAETFGAWAEKWLRGYQMSETTRNMRRGTYERDLKPKFGNRKLIEITHEDLRALTDAIVEQGRPSTAVVCREIMMLVFRWAIERGQKVENPADLVRPSTIAKFEPRDRALTPEEIGLMYQYMERIGTPPSIRAAAKLLLLTMVRKSELTNATWSEINFIDALWTIPKERMKRRNPHLVFLSRQVLEIFTALKTFAGGSEYVLPSRYDSDLPMSSATLNQVLTLTYRLAQKEGQSLGKFGPHDLRRTASTLLHEAGYNTDWIEKCLAHEQKGVRAVYNKAEYRDQRRAMLQDWADMIDEWTIRKIRPKD